MTETQLDKILEAMDLACPGRSANSIADDHASFHRVLAEINKADADRVNYDAKTGDVIEWEAPGGLVTAKVLETHPSYVVLKTEEHTNFAQTYSQLKRIGATFKEKK
jgi:hypothetical protein